MRANVDVVLRVFRAVEQRDAEELFSLYHPDVEFHDAPSLPYGGSVRGAEHLRELLERGETWLGTWGPLQPTLAERGMGPRAVAANDTEVVVLYRQRAVEPAGERLDTPVLGLYEVREGKFARAQMFHFDTAALVNFLTRAKGRSVGQSVTAAT
jgi:ketosteroid isomerase-like protein